VLVDFWAEWCAPCRMAAPHVAQAAKQMKGRAIVLKVDTEAQQQLSGMAGISSIPTLMIFRDGILLFNQAGALPGPALTELIGKVKELDMDEVRAEIAKQAEATPES